MGMTPSKLVGYTGATAVAIKAVIEWDAWLNRTHRHQEVHKLTDGSGGEETLWSNRPNSLAHLKKGFGSCFAYLFFADFVTRRWFRPTDQNSRFFILHALANFAITVASTPDACNRYTGGFETSCDLTWTSRAMCRACAQSKEQISSTVWEG
jgi:hypothetical protein